MSRERVTRVSFFLVLVFGNYRYSVSLRGWQTAYTVQTFRGFGIIAQFEDGRPAGKFDIPKVYILFSCLLIVTI